MDNKTNISNKQTRNNSITYLKALGICLMVLGHCECSIPHIVPFLYMFHMPLFFFISGLCFSPNYLRDFQSFLKKRIIRLYLPFVKWSIIFLLLHNFFFDIHFYDKIYGYQSNVSYVYDFKTIIEHFINIIFFMLDNEQQILGGFWFLRSLFFGSMISWIALRYLKKPWISALGLFMICIIMNKFVCEVPILKMHTREFAAAFIITVGYCFAYYKIPRFNLIYITISLVLTYIGTFYWHMEMALDSYSNKVMPEYLLTSILATWSIYSVLDLYKDRKFIGRSIVSFTGNNTLSILTWHFLSFKLVSFVIVMTSALLIRRLAEFPVIHEYSSKGWWIVYFIIGITFPLFLTITKNKIVSCFSQHKLL